MKILLLSCFMSVALISTMVGKADLIGKPAPLFQAQMVCPDGSVQDFDLKDYIGCKIVLYFYPMDNTIGCTKQAQNFRDNIARLDQANIILLGISCDSINSHKKFQEKYMLPYPLLSDSRLKRTISKLYGVDGFLYSKRKTILINSDGIVFKVFDHVAINQQVDDILRAFALK